jgi:hypothetical protein
VRKVFLVGCPRSGTTWLQIILGSHPEIATVRETHLFHWYVAGLHAHWRGEESSGSKDGLQVLLSQADFDQACRQFADVVFDRIAAWNPDARILLEKTPDHLRSWRLIRRLYPEARFLHIVRDPRAVTASLLAYGREPWGQGAPQDATAAAMLWRTNVGMGRDLPPHLGSDYFEVRYEDLAGAPDAVLARICAWLELAPIQYDAERFSIETLRRRRLDGPPTLATWDGRENFFRRGEAHGWRSELSPEQIETIELLCSDLMREIGYAPSGASI